jgi:hypothetical protein
MSCLIVLVVISGADHNMASWDCKLRKSYIPNARREAGYIDQESIDFLAKKHTAEGLKSMDESAFNVELKSNGDLVFTADETELRLEFEISELLRELKLENKHKIIQKLEAVFEEELEIELEKMRAADKKAVSKKK